MASDTLAHDINNLLQIVASSCERLTSAALVPADRQSVERIAHATTHAVRLIEQLMARSRGEPLASSRTEVGRALRAGAPLLAHALGERVTIALQTAPAAMWVSASESDLLQVLLNLALNAREAMPEGGTLTITATRQALGADEAGAAGLAVGRYAQLDVRDSGVGMTPETAAHAFERFYTARVGGGGTGLGLASVKQVIERCGGAIQLDSTLGAGTRFRLWLPLLEHRADDDAAELTSPEAGGELVLVVDDDRDVRELIAESLESAGYRTLSASTAQEALALAAQYEVDLAIADVSLPDLNGWALAARLTTECSARRVLVVSGHDDRPASGGEHASTPFLLKPFSQGALTRRVRELLDAPVSTSPGEAAPVAPEPSVLDQVPAPVFVVQQQRFVYVNDAFARSLNLPVDALMGHDSLDRVHPDDRAMAPWHPGRVESTWPVSTELRVRRGDGAERTFSVAVAPTVFAGEPALAGTAIDHTLPPDALNASVRMAALGRLAGGIAHDFNNLLLVIGGQLEQLRSAMPPSPPVERLLDTIGNAAERGALLTDQLLSFGRRQVLAPQVVDLGAFLVDVAGWLQTRLGTRVEMIVEQASNVPLVRADRPRLREVLRHLADNARDAMPHGGTLRLSLDCMAIDADLKARWTFLALGGAFVRLRAIDSGLGMDPGVTPHVFEPFFTTKGRGRGAGMGLASVYGLVKQSAGYVFVERTGPDGTCITVLLPSATEQTGSVTAASGRPAYQATPGPNPSILLVEDDVAVRELLVDVLSANGFIVSAAETAEQADLQARDRQIDLLLTDIDLPGMSGARLAATLTARLPGLRTILMSGDPDDGEIAAAGLGEAVVLKKPFSMTALVDRIGQVLDRPAIS